MASQFHSGPIMLSLSNEGVATNLEAALGPCRKDVAEALDALAGILAARGVEPDALCGALSQYVIDHENARVGFSLSEGEHQRLVDWGAVTFLTSSICEATEHMSPEHLLSLGLEYGEIEGEFYPLTDIEQNYVGDSSLVLFGHHALTGCSVVIGDRKYLAPAIEIDYGPEQDLLDVDQAAQANERLARRVAAMAQRFEGLWFASTEPEVEFSDRHGKFLIHLFIPIDCARALANDFQGWLAVLRFVAENDPDLSDFLANAG